MQQEKLNASDNLATFAAAAALFKSGAIVHHLSLIISAIAMAQLAFMPDQHQPSLFCVLFLGLIELWFAWRVAFDTALFKALSTKQLNTHEMDHALKDMGLIKMDRSDRPALDRYHGTLRLFILQCVIVAIQLLTYAAYAV